MYIHIIYCLLLLIKCYVHAYYIIVWLLSICYVHTYYRFIYPSPRSAAAPRLELREWRVRVLLLILVLSLWLLLLVLLLLMLSLWLLLSYGLLLLLLLLVVVLLLLLLLLLLLHLHLCPVAPVPFLAWPPATSKGTCGNFSLPLMPAGPTAWDSGPWALGSPSPSEPSGWPGWPGNDNSNQHNDSVNIDSDTNIDNVDNSNHVNSMINATWVTRPLRSLGLYWPRDYLGHLWTACCAPQMSSPPP